MYEKRQTGCDCTGLPHRCGKRTRTIMSTVAKLTFLSACIASGSLIAYVHYSQAADRERLHEGVRRDVERQRLKHLYATGAGNDIVPVEGPPATRGAGSQLQS